MAQPLQTGIQCDQHLWIKSSDEVLISLKQKPPRSFRNHEEVIQSVLRAEATDQKLISISRFKSEAAHAPTLDRMNSTKELLFRITTVCH